MSQHSTAATPQTPRRLVDRSEYWAQFGMTATPLVPVEADENDFDELVRDLDAVNKAFKNRMLRGNMPDPPRYPNALCVDGVAACTKTSFLEYLRQKGYTDQPLKISAANRTFARNTVPASSIGFTFTCLQLMDSVRDDFTVFDRLPYNNYDWHTIWMAIATTKLHRDQHVASATADETSSSSSSSLLWNEQYDLATLLRRQHTRTKKFYANMCPAILLVDSDEDKVKARMQARNEGSDAVRSDLRNYVSAQNVYYYQLWQAFPEQYFLVDLARYSHRFKELHEALAVCVVDQWSQSSQVASSFDMLPDLDLILRLTPTQAREQRDVPLRQYITRTLLKQQYNKKMKI